MRTLARAVTVAVALCAAGPAAAQADSIAFIKGGNVWLANPDGSGQQQVTSDGSADSGAYRSPSQADDGTIVAARYDEIVRMRRDGAVINRIDPPGSQGTIFLDGPPIGTAISPDGSLVAYSYAQAACPPGASCGVRRSTQYTYADRFTPAETFGSQRGVLGASWVGNARTLVFGGAGSQVSIDDVGPGDDSFVHWFDDAVTDLSDGELSRQGNGLAILHGYGADQRVAVYQVSGSATSGSPPAAPTSVCETAPSATYDQPTWSPDGKAIAYAGPGGIMISTLPGFGTATPCGGSVDTLVIAGGSEPDWGPANVAPVAPPTVPPAPPATPAGAAKRPAATSAYAKALARCKKLRSSKQRSRCIVKAKRARAITQCNSKRGKARARCVRAAKRRYR